MADEPTIVSGVGAAASRSSSGGPTLAKEIEIAMSDAVKQAMAEGISLDESDEIRARMLAARAAVLKAHAEAEKPE